MYALAQTKNKTKYECEREMPKGEGDAMLAHPHTRRQPSHSRCEPFYHFRIFFHASSMEMNECLFSCDYSSLSGMCVRASVCVCARFVLFCFYFCIMERLMTSHRHKTISFPSRSCRARFVHLRHDTAIDGRTQFWQLARATECVCVSVSHRTE